MRVSILAAAAILCGLLPSVADAKNSRTVINIAPRYLSAGVAASPYEYRGVVPQTDARFQPVTNSIDGRFDETRQDPWLVPYQRSSFSTDFDGFSGNRAYRR